MRQFSTAARRGAAAVPNPVDVAFEYEVTEGEFLEMTAHPPTSGQIALFMSHQARGGVARVQAMFQLLAAVLDDEDYELIEAQLQEGVAIDVIVEVIEYLIEEWGARPTRPSSASSPSRNGTGRRSTARPPRAARTT